MTLRHLRFALLLAVLIVLGVTGHLRLKFDTELLGLLPKDLPGVRGLELYQRHFSGKDEALITVTHAENAAGYTENLVNALRARPDLAKAVIWKAPWTEHPESAAELLAWFWLNRPPEEFAKLRERLDPANAPMRLEETVSRMTSSFSPMDLALAGWDPYGIADPALLQETGLFSADAGGEGGGSEEPGFASADGQTRILYVQLPPEILGSRACQKWYREIRALAEQHCGWAEVGYTGEPVFVAEISSQMEISLKLEIAGSMTFITILFLVMYRLLVPLLMMQIMFGLTVFTTVGLGGWIIGELNIINVGFAAMLVGLTVDYAIILYQETVRHPQITTRGLRRELGSSIWGSCCTTAVVFAAILTSHFPAIAQLGALVAIGMFVGALNALYVYAPAWLTWSRPRVKPTETPARIRVIREFAPRSAAWATIGVLLLVAALLLGLGLPSFDATPGALRPKHSQAYDTLELVQSALAGGSTDAEGPATARMDQEDLLMVVEGASPELVGRRLAELRPLLHTLQEQGQLASFQLPDALWPAPENQRANVALAHELAANLPALSQAALDAGFQEDALFLLRNAAGSWSRAEAESVGLPPADNPAARWILRRFASLRTLEGEFVALGILKTGEAAPGQIAQPLQALEGVHLANWSLLGEGLLETAMGDVRRMTPVLAGLLLVLLWLVFRGVREVALCVGCLLFSGLVLMAAMRVLGIQWNLLNILALPLLMGSAADYSIHTLVALRRLRTESTAEAEAHLAGIRRALVFCGLSTMAGFFSLTFSVSKGLSSLGQVCALGIFINMLTALMLLPAWWRRLENGSTKGNVPISPH